MAQGKRGLTALLRGAQGAEFTEAETSLEITPRGAGVAESPSYRSMRTHCRFCKMKRIVQVGGEDSCSTM